MPTGAFRGNPGRVRLRRGGVVRQRRGGRPPLRDRRDRAAPPGQRAIQRHGHRGAGARRERGPRLDLHVDVPDGRGSRWAAVCSQKTALEAFVKPTDEERYSSLDIWSGRRPSKRPGSTPCGPPDPAGSRPAWTDAQDQPAFAADPAQVGLPGQRGRSVFRARSPRPRPHRSLPDRRS